MKILITLLLFIYLPIISFSQNDKISVDSLFIQAKEYAYNGKRLEARQVLRNILILKSDHYDANVLLARTYSWDKQYDSARVELKKVLKQKFDYKDAIFAMIDAESWAGNADSALFYSKYGLSFYKNDEGLLLHKAKAENKLEDEKSAIETLNKLLEINPENEEAKSLLEEIIGLKNELTLDYSFEYHEVNYLRRLHIASIRYSRKTALGSVVLSGNLGDLHKKTENYFGTEIGKQVEIDFYPRLTKWNYLYMSYGYSNSILFPKHRAGLELFHKLPYSFEISAGFRFLQFQYDTVPSKDIFIYTGSIGKYYKNFWFSFRPFITPKSSGVSQSYNLFVRYYLNPKESYLSLSVGTGNSPDELSVDIGDVSISTLNSKNLKVGITHQLLKTFTASFEVGLKYEEYDTSTFRNVYTLNGKITKHF